MLELKLDNVSKIYGGHRAVDGIEYIYPMECTAYWELTVRERLRFCV